MLNFSEMGLALPLLKALERRNYLTPTPIQMQAIPPLLEGRDLIGIAQTGTGKTAAFALPILHKIAESPRPRKLSCCRVLVLSPTRELAGQIEASFRTYGHFLRASVGSVFGGVSIDRQIRFMRPGIDVLVATPGRLMDLVNQKAIFLNQVEILVLDEADHMLDMGFVDAIRQIVSYLPQVRQNIFFSATMPPEISDLAGQLVRNPAHVHIAPAQLTAERVIQKVIHCDSHTKQAILCKILEDQAIERALVFTRTKEGADRLTRHLISHGIGAESLHGNKSQSQRERALKAFRSGRARLLIATDIAARGLDVAKVSHVINFDLPATAESYIHRIGRTARGTESGMAISLCDRKERLQLPMIERLTRQKLERLANPLGEEPPEDRFKASPSRSPAKRPSDVKRFRDNAGPNRQGHTTATARAPYAPSAAPFAHSGGERENMRKPSRPSSPRGAERYSSRPPSKNWAGQNRENRGAEIRLSRLPASPAVASQTVKTPLPA